MFSKGIKAALFIVYALVFGEFFMRIMDPQPMMPRYVQGSSDGIRMNIPNSTYWQHTPEVDVEFRINSQGIRSNREIPLAKPEGVCRIVTMGDSFMMGYEVSLENSFAYLVEHNLQAAGIPAETVNLAVSGFGTAEHLITLQSRGAPFNPDLVIMEWHSTDPKDNKRSNLFKVSDGKLARKNQTYLPAIKVRERLMKIPGYEWLIGNSHLYSVIRESAAVFSKKLLLSLRSKGDSKNLEAEEDLSEDTMEVAQNDNKLPPDFANEYPDPLDELLINEVDSVTRSIGAKLVLMDVPMDWKKKAAIYSAFEYLDLDAIANVDRVSPYLQFKEYSDKGQRMYYDLGQGHWNIKGNQVAAKVMTQAIIENGWCKK